MGNKPFPGLMKAIAERDVGAAIKVTSSPDVLAFINSKDEGGNLPLTFATQKGLSEVVEALLNAKADVGGVDARGNTALAFASQGGHAKIASTLLDACAAVEIPVATGNTPLMLASQGNHADVLKVLLERKASVSAQKPGGSGTGEGWTALFFAAFTGGACAAELLGAKADANFVSADGYNALALAAQYGHADIIDALVQHNADLNIASGRKGQTALHIAAMHKRKTALKTMLELGADKELRDKDGRTAKDVAKGDVADLL